MSRIRKRGYCEVLEEEHDIYIDLLDSGNMSGQDHYTEGLFSCSYDGDDDRCRDCSVKKNGEIVV